MSEKTAISWTDHTFNPHWGCIRVSPGCEHCYAETFAKRVGQAVWGPKETTPRRTFGAKHWAEPLAWHAAAEREGRRHRVFCASMGDVFEDHPALPAERARLWALIAATPWLDWQLLTKRPENVRGMVPWGDQWPANVWLGTTVEDQQRADERIPHLLAVPAAVHFLSCEPLLGPVALFNVEFDAQTQVDVLTGDGVTTRSPAQSIPNLHLRHTVNWVIIGGESGPRHRPMDLAWARSLVEQCSEAGVAVWFKQAGGLHPGRGEDALGRIIHEFPQVGVPA